MKKILFAAIACIAIATNLNAQSRAELKIRELFWGPENKDAQVTTFPEKWNNESAVVLFQQEFFEYTNTSKSTHSPNGYQFRIKLLDKNAVEKYSEYQFESKLRYGYFSVKEAVMTGIKVVKANGKEQIIDIEKERIETETNGVRHYKIAIAGLEIGDILDIYSYEDSSQMTAGTQLFPKIERTIAGTYPIVKTKLSVEVENDFFLRMETMNGAPEIKEIPTDKRSTSRYEFVDTNVEKQPKARWSYPLVNQPSLKMQVVFALRSSNEDEINFFIPENDRERGSYITDANILRFVENYNGISPSTSPSKAFNQGLENKSITSEKEKVEYIINYARHYHYTDWFEAITARNASIDDYAAPCENFAFFQYDHQFIRNLSGYLNHFEIDFDVVFTKPRYDAPMSKTLLRSNVVTGLKINIKGEKPMYVFDFGADAQLDAFNPVLEGTDAKLFNIKKGRKLTDISNHNIPLSTATDNVYTEKTDVRILDSWDGFKLERDRQFTGNQKSEGLNNHITFQNYIDEDRAYFNSKPFYNCKDKQSKKDKEKEEKMLAALSKLKTEALEDAKKSVNTEFDLEIDNFEMNLVESGRFNKDIPLHFTDGFTLGNDYIKKAGPNYIVEVGKFIGGQITIDKEEYDRKVPVDLDYATTYSYEVRIEIPAGYTVEGVSNLNKNVSNSTGSFTSTARVEGDKLIYTTKKVYLKQHVPAAQWQEMVKWLDEANNFTREKILFKKS